MEQFGYNIDYNGTQIFVQLNPFDKEVIQKYCATLEQPNCYVEIGTDMGGSAILARGSTKADVHTIDIRNQFQYELKGINKIVGASVDVAKSWNKPIGVLFIDGNHTEAKADFLAWEKYVVKGGYILFHDHIVSPYFTVIEDCAEVVDDKYEIIYKPTDLENTRILIIKKK